MLKQLFRTKSNFLSVEQRGFFFAIGMVVSFFYYQPSYGQSEGLNSQLNSSKRFRVGDRLPDLELGKVINASYSAGKLSKFKNKLIILSFWNTHCGPCLTSLPKMDSLQKEFGDKIEIIPVTEDSQEWVEKMLNKRWAGSSRLKLPFVVSDSSLRESLLYGAVPHEVWIDKDANIIAITDQYAVTSENIRKALADGQIAVKMKPEIKKHKFGVPLFLNENDANVDNLLHQSIFTRRIGTVTVGNGNHFLNKDNDRFWIYAYNFPIRNLMLLAFEREGYGTNRIILESAKDSSYFFGGKTGDIEKDRAWKEINTYSYELIYPVIDRSQDLLSLKKKGLKMMRRDLNNFLDNSFGLTAGLETRKVKCLVLVKHGKEEKFKGTEGVGEMLRIGTGKRVWKNKPMSQFADDLCTFSSIFNDGSFPVIVDGTNYAGNVNVAIDQENYKSITLLKKQLQSFGLDLVEGERVMEVIVLKERGEKEGQMLTAN